ncbi:MAG: alpha/beta hydrolase [Candidatus Omnitrophica bacterium]|nr:alpha/beta hydrolase [Candidatus Omnitrophota bacterium]
MKTKLAGVLIALMCFQFSGCAVLTFINFMPRTYSEVYSVKTQDDWTLVLQRYYQKGHVKYKNPVILCHGMGYNAEFWDIGRKRSFAKYLADRGFDVWSVSLRGAGKSSKPGWLAFRELLSFRPDDLSNMSLNANKLNWNIDDYIRYDVPAIVAKVKEVTGQPQVDWVGHSIGGMIVFAHLESAEHPEEIGNVMAIAPSCVHLKPQNAALDFVNKKKFIFDFGLLVNQKTLYKILVPFRGMVRDPLADLFYSKDNMDPGTISKLYNHVVENVSPGVMNQIVLMLKEEYFVSSDGKINYTEEMTKINNPILFVAGRDDNLSDPESVRYGYRKVSSTDKTYLEFSTLNGTKMDYGHDDLIIGKRVQDEVYPKLYNWLVSHSKPK